MTKDQIIEKLKTNPVGFKFRFINTGAGDIFQYEAECRLNDILISWDRASALSPGSVEYAYSIVIDLFERDLWKLIESEKPEDIRRPHAELIHAWADGAEIQKKIKGDWVDIEWPAWNADQEYRIKPAVKMKTLYKVVFFIRNSYFESQRFYADVETYEKTHSCTEKVLIGINPQKFIEVPETDPDHT